MGAEESIRAFLSDNFIVDGDAANLRGDASLTELGVVDSMGVLEVILFLEEEFGIVVGDDEAVPENLDTVDNLVRFVESKQAYPEESHARSGAPAY